jgi:hypothetical protein
VKKTSYPKGGRSRYYYVDPESDDDTATRLRPVRDTDRSRKFDKFASRPKAEDFSRYEDRGSHDHTLNSRFSKDRLPRQIHRELSATFDGRPPMPPRPAKHEKATDQTGGTPENIAYTSVSCYMCGILNTRTKNEPPGTTENLRCSKCRMLADKPPHEPEKRDHTERQPVAHNTASCYICGATVTVRAKRDWQ